MMSPFRPSFAVCAVLSVLAVASVLLANPQLGARSRLAGCTLDVTFYALPAGTASVADGVVPKGALVVGEERFVDISPVLAGAERMEVQEGDQSLLVHYLPTGCHL